MKVYTKTLKIFYCLVLNDVLLFTQSCVDCRTAKLEICHHKMCQTSLCHQQGKRGPNLPVAHGGCPPPRSLAWDPRPVVVVL